MVDFPTRGGPITHHLGLSPVVRVIARGTNVVEHGVTHLEEALMVHNAVVFKPIKAYAGSSAEQPARTPLRLQEWDNIAVIYRCSS
jgi:hypothetical protein